MVKYEFRPVTTRPDELARLVEFFPRCFGTTNLSLSTIHWQYADNPEGQVIGFNAFAGDELAAHYVAIPIRSRLFGRPAKGLLSINTATAPGHQGQGLFTRLAELTYAAGADRGFEFVIGVANANSVHGFTRKLGFQDAGLLRRRLSLTPPASGAGDGLDFMADWNADRLAWRLSGPGQKYLAVRSGAFRDIYARSSSGRVWVLANRVPADLPLASGVSESERPPGRFRLWLGADPDLRWNPLTSAGLPGFLRQVPLTLIFRDLSGGGRRLDPKRVRFWSHDFDAY